MDPLYFRKNFFSAPATFRREARIAVMKEILLSAAHTFQKRCVPKIGLPEHPPRHIHTKWSTATSEKLQN